MRIRSVVWKNEADPSFDMISEQVVVPPDLFDYISPLKNSPGPLFTVAIKDDPCMTISHAIVLENVQDPGNVGTVIRTANAMNISAVILCGSCADLYHPRTVRATMGAIFRQTVLCIDTPDKLSDYIKAPLYGAALSDCSKDIRFMNLADVSIVIGNEGKGLSEEMKELCDELVIIPMSSKSESLNAAAAASIFMWEMAKSQF